MRRRHGLGIYWQPPDSYTFDTLPAYLQHRCRNGQGYIEPLKGRDRVRRMPGHWSDFDEELYDDLFVPLTPWELRRLRRLGEEYGTDEPEELTQAQIEAQEAEQERRRKQEMKKYLKRYLLTTGLAREARKAGVGLNWLFEKL